MSENSIANLDTIVEFEQEIKNWLAESGFDRLHVATTTIYPQKPMFPEEAAIVANSVMVRRAEFAAGRYCGRKALNRLGFDDLPILRGKKGEPIWPDSVVGSISHDRGIAIAAVSPVQKNRNVGIDLLAISHNIDIPHAQIIADRFELENVEKMLSWIESHSVNSNVIDPILLAFSAKESIIKCISPTIDFYLDFRDIEICCKGKIIQATFPRLKNMRLDVWWHIFDGMIFTISHSQ